MDVRIEPGWKAALASEFQQPYFRELTDRVREEYRSPTPVFPPAQRIFAAFDSCPFEQVKVVIIGQDPYHGPRQANGLCFSVPPGVALPPSLLNIFKEVADDTGVPLPSDGDLSRWAKQGVLLLNSILTVRMSSPRSHVGWGWERFTDAAVRALAEKRENIVFLLWGADAIKKGSFIPRDKHLVLTSPHPSPLSAYRGFFGNKHFSSANRYLAAHGRSPIVW